MERWKIAVACFIGGVLLGAVAFLLAPAYSWFGLLAGIAGGYLSYEFREVLHAIPRAWTAAVAPETRRAYVVVLRGLAVGLGAIFMTGINFSPLLLVAMSMGPYWQEGRSSELAFLLWWTCFIAGIAWVAFHKILPKPPGAFVTLGEFRELILWWNPVMLYGYQIPRGTWWVMRRIPAAVAAAGIALGRFAWHLFILIHRKERLLCVVDGTLGGAVAWLWLSPSAETVAAKVFVTFACGLLGAAFGVINYEVVSKRVLKLVPSS